MEQPENINNPLSQEVKIKKEELAQRESLLRKRLGEIVKLPYEEEWVKSWMKDILAHEGGDEEIENFFQNVSKSEILRDVLQEDIGLFESLFYEAGKYIFDQPESIEILVHNVKERNMEILKNNKDKNERIVMDPQATDEEYQLGTYKEAIESQVRAAVFTLQKKGYTPMESGFYELPNGSQYIGLIKTEGVDEQKIIDTLNRSLDFKALKISRIPVNVFENRLQIIIIPEDGMTSLDGWKTLWDKVVSCLPVLDSSLEDKKSDNGDQGERFRTAQDRIKEGENAWLAPGLAFVDGKVVNLSYQDFINLEKTTG